MDNLLNWLSVLHDKEDIVELRSIGPKFVISGYFKAGSPKIITELARYPQRTFYQTMNYVDKACYSRDQQEQLVAYPKITTSDADIVGYQWILVDADPVRPAGISATNEEKEAALNTIRAIYTTLKHRGFCDPVTADSGNGYHLLYRIKAELSKRKSIEQFLKMLDVWFSTDSVKVDTTVSNPARITKLYGTVAQKGANTEDRPHRTSRIIRVPETIELTPLDLVVQIADEYSATAAPNARPNVHPDDHFDLEQYLAEHQVEVAKKTDGPGYTKYVLKECPFDSAHKAPDAAVFQYANGARGFKCFHNSCSDYSWHDFRTQIDPNAYCGCGTSSIQPFNMPIPFPQLIDDSPQPSMEVPQMATPSAPVTEPEAIKQPEIMLNITDIQDEDRSKKVVIKSRFPKIDALIGGFNKGELSIWSGGNASGKSTLVSQLGLEAVHQGFKVAMFSGEMTASRVKRWVYLQAAGRDNVELDPLDPMHYRLKAGIHEKLDSRLDGHLSIYNNDYGNSWEQVTSGMFDWVVRNHADLMIIDNLMALDLPVGKADKYEVQTQIAKALAQAAKQLQIHIHFICHPRKADMFLRKNDISGSSDLTNAADNVFMVHRVNADFIARVKEIYPRLQVPADVGNAVEIMKNRDIGVVDEMVLLYFDKTCKTMSDVKGGLPMFGWTESFEQQGFIVLSPEDTPEMLF